METPDVNQVLANVIATLLLAVAAGVGGIVTRWLTMRAKRRRDRQAAQAKIRRIYDHLGWNDCPDVACLDELFRAIRRVEKHLGIKEDDHAGDRVAEGGAPSAGENPGGQVAQGSDDR